MSKKSFEDFYNGTSFEVYGCHKNNLKKAWEACESQHKADVEELKKTVSSQTEIIYKLENECSFDYKCPVNSNLQKQNEELKKKLEEAVGIIELVDYQFCTSFGDAENMRNSANKAREFLEGVKGE